MGRIAKRQYNDEYEEDYSELILSDDEEEENEFIHFDETLFYEENIINILQKVLNEHYNNEYRFKFLKVNDILFDSFTYNPSKIKDNENIKNLCNHLYKEIETYKKHIPKEIKIDFLKVTKQTIYNRICNNINKNFVE